MNKYRARVGFAIEHLEIERETEKSVWRSINGRLHIERKVSDTVSYFDAWEEAKEFLLKCAKKDVDKARRSLEYYEEKYKKVESTQQEKK